MNLTRIRQTLPGADKIIPRVYRCYRDRDGLSFGRVQPTCEAISKTDVRVLFAREIFTRFLAIAKLLKLLVARDGIEPPTPDFSGPLTESPKWFEINRCH